MPVYEYRCRGCGEEFEAFLLGVSETILCPGCGGLDLQKKVSVTSCSSGGCGPSPSGFS